MFESIDQCLENLRNQFDVITEIRCDYDSIETATVDLYLKLQKIRQEKFEHNQRIVFVLEHDFYDDISPCGALLQAIQIIVQDIDISNFFVCILSSNSDVSDEYFHIWQKISSDPVPFNLYTYAGSFSKIIKAHKRIDGKNQSLKGIILSGLKQRHKELLFEDPVFCLMPWVGINIRPDNEVRPCCEYQGPAIGNTANQTISEIWNSEPLRQIRRSMLQKQPVTGCETCYHKERVQSDSLRNTTNREFAHHAALIDSTDQDDHEIPTQSIVYWDIRYNNLCNFACRSCHPGASTSWYQIHNDLYPDQKLQFPLMQVGHGKDKIFREISQNIDLVEKIYFAGGEPLIIENFYRVLEILDAHGRHDVHLCYNTNLSKLSLKNYSILDLWQRFSKVSVAASLDAMGDRAAYLRTGTVWENIVENRKRIQDQCPHVDFYVSATIGLINALHVIDFHTSWIEQQLITPDDFNINLLYKPAYMSIKNAPERLRQKIINRYSRHIECLKDHGGRSSSGFRSVINFCREPGQYDSQVFWREIRRLDRYHSTDLLSTFPELQDSDL